MTVTDRDRMSIGPRDEKPVGSIAWCWQTIHMLKRRWERKDLTDQQYAEVLQELQAEKVWEIVPPEQPYGSLDALLQAEIGVSQEQAHRRFLGRGGDRRSQEFQTYLGKFEKPKHGNRSDYIEARLKAHFPAIYEAYQRGDYQTIKAAGRAAGFVPPAPMQMTLSPAPGKFARDVRAKKDWDFIDAVILEWQEMRRAEMEEEEAEESTSYHHETAVEAAIIQQAALPTESIADVETVTTNGLDPRYFLGTLCHHGHDHEGTGQSLRYSRKGHGCVACVRERLAIERTNKRRQTTGVPKTASFIEQTGPVSDYRLENE